MELDTNTLQIGGTTYLRIPSAMVAYFQLTENKTKVIIEELSRKEAKIRFEK